MRTSCPRSRSRAGLGDTHAGLPLPGPHEGVALTQFLSWPQMACGTLGRTQRVAAFWKLLFFSNFPSLFSWWLLFEGSPRWFPLTHLSAFESKAFHRSGCECGSAGAAGGAEQGLGMLEGRRFGAVSLCPGKVPGELTGSAFALSFAPKSGSEPGISVPQEPALVARCPGLPALCRGSGRIPF